MMICLRPATPADELGITALECSSSAANEPVGQSRPGAAQSRGGGMMTAVHLGAHDATRTRVLTAADLPAALALQRQVERNLPARFLRGKTE